MFIGRSRSKPDGHTIAESIAELVRELAGETLERAEGEQALALCNAAPAQPD
jgi:hypothetical protein